MTYLDTSAILRLILPHGWTPSLEAYLAARGAAGPGTSVIGVVETHRGLMQEGATEEEFVEGVRILAAMRKVAITDEIVRSASTIPGRHLRSLDAFHVASAIEAGATVLVTYDQNMAAAARGVGLKVVSPGVN